MTVTQAMLSGRVGAVVPGCFLAAVVSVGKSLDPISSRRSAPRRGQAAFRFDLVEGALGPVSLVAGPFNCQPGGPAARLTR
jgi:hypothetical protein